MGLASAHPRSVAIVLLLASAAHASPEAEQLFRDGRALAAHGDWPTACDRFERSRALEEKVGTLLNLADCREHLGQLATAWSLFLEAKSLATRDGDPRRAREADRRASSLAPRLPYLRVVVEPAAAVAGLVVTRSGAVAPSPTWNLDTPVDPGALVITASAPDRQPWSTTVTIGPGEHASVTIPVLVSRAPALAVSPAVIAPPVVVASRAASAPREFALGAGVTFGTDLIEAVIVGGRVIASTPSGPGVVRGIGSIVTYRYEDEPTRFTRTITFGAGVDYLLPLSRQLRVGGGLGVGLDYDRPDHRPGDTDPRPNDVGSWWSLRLSPMVARFRRGRIELGLHGQLIRAGDEWQRFVTIAVDGFVW